MEMITDFFPNGLSVPKQVLKTIPKYKKEKITNMSKDQFKSAKKEHKGEIAKINQQIAKLKADKKAHRLLIRQARIMYKVTKVKGSK